MRNAMAIFNPSLSGAFTLIHGGNMNAIEYQEQQRKILVNDLTDELMKEEHNPFTYKNFVEAMQNLDESSYFTLAAMVGSLNNIPNNGIMKEMLAECFIRIIREYHEPIARAAAEKQIPCSGQLDDDQRAGI